jgi:hypothetical protein
MFDAHLPAYPMVKQVRAMIAGNQLGKIRKVMVEYPKVG